MNIRSEHRSHIHAVLLFVAGTCLVAAADLPGNAVFLYEGLIRQYSVLPKDPHTANGGFLAACAMWTRENPSSPDVDWNCWILEASNDGQVQRMLDLTGGQPGTREQCPTLATDGHGHWVAAWQQASNLPDSQYRFRLCLSRSEDNGVTWSESEPLPIAAPIGFPTDDQFPTLVATNPGAWVIAWYSNRLRKAPGIFLDLLICRSTDNGRTWSSPARFEANLAYENMVSEPPALKADSHGHWVVVWQQAGVAFSPQKPSTRLMTARSADNGATWEPQKPLLAKQNELDDCIQPALETNNDGTWIVSHTRCKGGRAPAYASDDTIQIVTSYDDGVSWGRAKVVSVPRHRRRAGLSRGPVLSTDGNGHWMTAWEETLGIRAAASNDNGKHWSSPTFLVFTDYKPEIHDSPRLVPGDNGKWRLFWLAGDFEPENSLTEFLFKDVGSSVFQFRR